ncbi:hypothetical protein TRIUR3_25183 [Triticum urartu]|uniref:Leucine-rich repeat-containing N-terminal plant-type domain-containing protein n=1 Tax=Triticum urartu TaxID=4572 RepID=M8A6U3_TRIUA|nr:hypothetical protein TRIUR3_25183 [Triticum urartu]
MAGLLARGGVTMVVRHSAAESGADRSLGWGVKSADPCDGIWPGVRCDKDLHVIAINASCAGLSGTLSGTDLANLRYLTELDLSFNSLGDPELRLAAVLDQATAGNLEFRLAAVFDQATAGNLLAFALDGAGAQRLAGSMVDQSTGQPRPITAFDRTGNTMDGTSQRYLSVGPAHELRRMCARMQNRRLKRPLAAPTARALA